MPSTTTVRESAASEAWRLIHALFVSEKHRFAAIAAEFDLSPPQLHALHAIDPDEPMPMSDLAATLRCDNSNVTGIVDRLEDRGLVARRPAAHDRRVKHLVVTEHGAAVREQISRRIYAPPPALLALGADDQRTLRDVLRRALG